MGVQIGCECLREDKNLVYQHTSRGYDKAVEIPSTPALEREKDGDEEFH
jgi:hypothetical protein